MVQLVLNHISCKTDNSLDIENSSKKRYTRMVINCSFEEYYYYLHPHILYNKYCGATDRLRKVTSHCVSTK